MTQRRDLKGDRLLDELGRRMLRRRVESLKSLPAFPESILRINQLLSRDGPQESLGRIAAVIETDPVLSARVLRLVNSAFYGVSGAIGTIFDALLLLGLDIVKGLILSSTVADLFGGRGSPVHGLWEHSFGAAIAASALARELGLPRPEEISAAALMHDLGKVVLGSQLTSEYADVVENARTQNTSIRAAELVCLGVSHQEIGQWLVERWNFPPGLAAPIAWHHEPERAGPHVVAASAVHLADVIVRGYGFGFAGDELVPPLSDQAWSRLSMTHEKLRRTVRRMHVDLQGALVHVNAMWTP